MQGCIPSKLAGSWRGLVMALAAAVSVTACATTPAPSSHMPSGAMAMPPAGLLDMCQRLPEVCGDAGRTARASLSDGVVLAGAEETATGAVVLGGDHDGAKSVTAPDPVLMEGVSRATSMPSKDALAQDDAMDADGDREGALFEDALASDGGITTPDLSADAESLPIADAALFTLLNRVNQSINMAIRPRDDIEVHGVAEFWTLPLSVEGIAEGDCEDYALEKRRALIEAGVPESALFLAVGHSQATGRHAVLVVSTHSGDYVLDNMTPHILPWSQAPYVWLLRQMPGDLLAWRHTGTAIS